VAQNTAQLQCPMMSLTMTKYLYAYTHRAAPAWERPDGTSGKFAIKVGETTKPGEARVREQVITTFPDMEGVTIFFHSEEAIRPDGTEFGDRVIHRLLEKAGVARVGGEWFAASELEVRSAIAAVQSGQDFELSRTQHFEAREEQEEAVRLTANYFREKGSTFLWNAKMRFGKTFTSYLLAEEMDWRKVLVLTYKPAVRSAWKTDLLSHQKFQGWKFIDAGNSQEQSKAIVDSGSKFVWFASFQDATGRTPSGNPKARNEILHDTQWDCIIIDEFHFGASTAIAKELYDPQDIEAVELARHLIGISGEDETETDVEGPRLQLKSKFQLHLSGTPFKALTSGDYNEDQVFEWTYAQEQKRKKALEHEENNPYSSLPSMEMYTYSLDGELTSRAIDSGLDEFSLKTFFEAKRLGQKVEFERADDVDRFLNLIRGVGVNRDEQEFNSDYYPYSSPKFNAGAQHSIWLMSNVAQCEAMYEKLTSHSFFSAFKIHKAYGSKAGIGAAALPPLQKAIAKAKAENAPGTITLTCGKLMTGVTVSEWTSIFMLTTLKAPESYFQAAFRVQSPMVSDGKVIKDKCFVFEFDPQRALNLVAGYATQLSTNSSGSGVTQSSVLKELLSYLPIFAIADGQLEKLDADSLIEWSNAGLSANSLARKLMNPSNFNLDSSTLARLLADEALLAELKEMDDFRDFDELATKVISSTDRIKKLKSAGTDARKVSSSKQRLAKERTDIRKKLRKLNARLTLFMYLTDYREEKLMHIVESLDASLFQTSTGLTLNSFQKLVDYGLFRPAEMTQTIQKYRYFERQSLLAHHAKINAT
jgi:hypothetical protein